MAPTLGNTDSEAVNQCNDELQRLGDGEQPILSKHFLLHSGNLQHMSEQPLYEAAV